MTTRALTLSPPGEQFSAIVLRPEPPHPVQLVLTGELDLAAGHALGLACAELLSGAVRPRQVQVDLTSVSFLDSAGIGELLRARAVLAQLGVRLELLGAQGQCLRLLRFGARLGWLQAPASESGLPRGSG